MFRIDLDQLLIASVVTFTVSLLASLVCLGMYGCGAIALLVSFFGLMLTCAAVAVR